MSATLILNLDLETSYPLTYGAPNISDAVNNVMSSFWTART